MEEKTVVAPVKGGKMEAQAPHHGQSGATTGYVALAEKWEEKANLLEKWNAEKQEAHCHFQHGQEVTYRICAKELRAM